MIEVLTLKSVDEIVEICLAFFNSSILKNPEISIGNINCGDAQVGKQFILNELYTKENIPSFKKMEKLICENGNAMCVAGLDEKDEGRIAILIINGDGYANAFINYMGSDMNLKEELMAELLG